MVGKALSLRADLLKAVKTFQGVFMLTLTIDPKIFNDPAAEFAYVADKRCVAKLVAALRRESSSAKLYSKRFFAIREFHQDGRVHYHVLLDAKFVDIHRVRELWGRFEPKDYVRPADDKSPRFGSVVYSKKDIVDKRHAAMYVTKYLTKGPEGGFPEWVLKRPHALQRYSVSHRFWASCGVDRGRQEVDSEFEPEKRKCEPECFCDRCVGRKAASLVENRGGATWQRVASCQTKSIIIEVTDIMAPDGEIHTVKAYVARLKGSAKAIAEHFGIENVGRRFVLKPEEVDAIIGKTSDESADDIPERYTPWLKTLVEDSRYRGHTISYEDLRSMRHRGSWRHEKRAHVQLLNSTPPMQVDESDIPF